MLIISENNNFYLEKEDKSCVWITLGEHFVAFIYKVCTWHPKSINFAQWDVIWAQTQFLQQTKKLD